MGPVSFPSLKIKPRSQTTLLLQGCFNLFCFIGLHTHTHGMGTLQAARPKLKPHMPASLASFP